METFIFTRTTKKFYTVKAKDDLSAKRALEALDPELLDQQNLVQTEDTGLEFYGIINQ